MAISRSEFGKKELLSALTSENGTLVLNALEEIDSRTPTREEAKVIKEAYSLTKDPVLAFQIKTSLRLAAFKLKDTKFKVSLTGLEKLLSDPERIDDLALGVITVVAGDAFLAADFFRQANWQNMSAKILPSFCRFFRRHGNIQDSQALEELTRHPDPTVITAALVALEKIAPDNIQSLIEPLLSSPSSVIKAQAIQAFYRSNPSLALSHLLKMLFADDEKEIILALHHATFFPYAELESYLIRLLTQTSSPAILMRISKILKSNAHPELPFRIFWVNRLLEGQHQNLVKGILLGVVHSLAEKKLIDCSVQDYLAKLKTQIKEAEMKLLKDTCSVTDEDELEDTDEETSQQKASLPALEELESPKTGDQPVNKTTPTARPVKDPEADFDSYDQLTEQQRIQLLNRINATSFKNLLPQLLSLYNNVQGKELAAIINLFGKFGDQELTERVKKHIKSDNQDVICACIKALTKLDSDYLCLYLPQFMQHKNGKIRMTATRNFVTIDRDSIKSLLSGLIASSNVRQRTLGVSTSLLVDFNIVRHPLIEALAKENSTELIEKIGMVLSSNPDRELLKQSYSMVMKSTASLKNEKMQVVQMIADKLAIALNNISTSEELLTQIEKDMAKDLESQKHSAEMAEKRAEQKSVADSEKSIVVEQSEKIKTILTSQDVESKTKRAKMSTIIWLLVAVAWGAVIAIGFLHLLS